MLNQFKPGDTYISPYYHGKPAKQTGFHNSHVEVAKAGFVAGQTH